jgi:hypothetical protein
MPTTYDESRGPGKNPGWCKIGSFKLPDREKVNIWLTIHASTLSMGMGDAFEVPECWKSNGKWFHVHQGKEMEIDSRYVTHWRPVRITNGSPAEQLSQSA